MLDLGLRFVIEASSVWGCSHYEDPHIMRVLLFPRIHRGPYA